MIKGLPALAVGLGLWLLMELLAVWVEVRRRAREDRIIREWERPASAPDPPPPFPLNGGTDR